MILHAPDELTVYYSKLLNPDPAQDINGRKLPQQGGLFIQLYLIQEPQTVLTDLLRVG